MMHAVGLDHATVVVTDVDRSRAFYGGLLGLEEVPPPYTFDFVVLWFRLGSQFLHLLLKPEADPLGPRHFALLVDDAAAARTHCVERGLHVRETVAIPGADRFFIADPDGNRIEVIQWVRPYGTDAPLERR